SQTADGGNTIVHCGAVQCWTFWWSWRPELSKGYWPKLRRYSRREYRCRRNRHDELKDDATARPKALGRSRRSRCVGTVPDKLARQAPERHAVWCRSGKGGEN